MQAMDQVAHSLASATLVSGPATAAERAQVDSYIVDSENEDETTSSEIDAFEKRLAAQKPAERAQRSEPTLPAQRSGAKPVPHHLLGLLDGPG